MSCIDPECNFIGECPGGDNTSSSSGTTSGTLSSGSGGGGSNGGSGDSGGSGGAGAAGGASATSSSGTGTPTCDDAADTCGRDTNTGCYKCAIDGPCKEVRQPCVDSSECRDLAVCIHGCAEEEDPATCIETCRTDNAAAVDAYDALMTCAICEECAENCDAAGEPVCNH